MRASIIPSLPASTPTLPFCEWAKIRLLDAEDKPVADFTVTLDAAKQP
jgi:hypothetical protein